MVDIDGDGSFLMNVQELATAKVDGLETKVFILNNQHLGMVVQWEDRFYKRNRAHTYLGRREGAGRGNSVACVVEPSIVAVAIARMGNCSMHGDSCMAGRVA